MPQIETKPPQTEPRTHCPLCDAPLDPQTPDECPKCDWVTGYRRRTYGGTARDRASVLLSVIPGLGHMYKGHRLLGMLLMMGSCFAGAAALLAGTASAGWGVLLLPLYWIGVMLHVYFLEDIIATAKAPR
jgi:hypothetical protein